MFLNVGNQPIIFLKAGCISTACCLAISSYILYIIITAKSMAVPEVRAPNKSATEENKPIAKPPIIVKGIIYLFKIASKTLGSFLKPGICNPEARIFFAWEDSSIPDVLTQNTANIAER